MRKIPILVLVLCLSGAGIAQQSTSYKLSDQTFNAGGHPDDGVMLTSASYGITLDALGNAVSGTVLVSTSYSVQGGFVAGHPPPVEVNGLLFAGRDDLEWGPERSAGHYNLYRDPLVGLPAMGYGVCRDHHLSSTAYHDPDLPGSGEGLFYLVTAVNTLGEEGSKGWDSDGAVRGNPSPCP
jgi:hypothetical protein